MSTQERNEERERAAATREAVEARRRLGRVWPIVALVTGLAGVALVLLVAWLVV